MALSNKTLEGIQKSVKLHLNWLIKSIVGEEALTTAELKDLEGFTLLPSSSLDFIKKSFFLGRLSAILRKKEYKEVTLSSVEKAMQTATLSPIELLAIQEAKQSAGLHFKTLAADIEAGIYSKLAATNLAVVNEATVLNIVRDEVALAILEHKTWTTLAENLSQSLKTENSKKIQKIARTELHAAKQKGIVQAIANKIDIYGISDGPDSLVSVVTHAGRCEDCASLYEENGSYKIFKLSELLKNGTNVDSKHTRENGLHNHWKPVVPPAHPECFPAGTEILTRHGWKTIESVQVNEEVLSLDPETKNLDYVPVKHTVKSFSDTLLEFSSNNYSLTCTPNHELVVLTDWQHKNKKKIQKIPANKVTKSSYLYRSSEWVGQLDDSWDMFGFTPEQFCEFMGYFLSEGSLHPYPGQIDIAQFKPASKQTMLSALEKMPFKTVSSCKTGIYLKHRELWEYLKQFGKSNEKFIPEEIKLLPPEYITIFLDAFALGDGHRRPVKQWKGGKFREELVFFTSSGRLSSDIGELLLKTGFVPSYKFVNPTTVVHHNGTYTDKHGIWRISRCYNKQAAVSYMTITERPHNNAVYCVELEKFNTLYIRQNGKCTWAGNCFCEIRYLPPGAVWQGKTLVLAAPEALQKAIGDSKLSAVQKPKGPPPSGPQAPATPGNVPGVASPAKAVGTAGAKPSSKANSNPTGIKYEWYKGKGQPPSGDNWEAAEKRDGSTGWKRPVGSGKHGSGQEDEPVDQEAVDEVLMNASKAFGLAGHSSNTILEKLNTAKIAAVKGTDEGTKGQTESYVVALEDGPRAILKPPANFNNVYVLAGAAYGDGMQSIPVNTGHRREEAAYHGYNMLGLTDAVPPTTIREHEGIDCSIQAWSENHKPIWKSILEDEDTKLYKEASKLYGSIHDAPDNLVQVMLDMVPADKREAFIEQLSAGTVAAMVFNHNDQHFNNVLIDHDTWELKFIDNTAAFGNGLEGCKQQAHMEMHNMGMKLKIPEKLQTRMANMTLGDVKRSIGPYIEDWAVGQTYMRMKYMLHLQDTEGHLDYEKFRPTMGYGAEKYADKQVPRPGGFWAGTEGDQHEEFHRRKDAGLLQNQLFNSFAKQWLSDAEKLPDDHPDKIAAKEIADIGIFLGPGMATGATMYRSDKKHIAFEKTVKPGYPPKDIINATGILSEAPGKSAPEPKKILMSPRDLAAFGGVPKSPPPIPDDAKKTMKKEPAKTADDIKTAKPVKHKVFAKPGSNEEKKTIKKNLYIRLDSVWER